MTTNLTVLILSLLVTNVSEQIVKPDRYSQSIELVYYPPGFQPPIREAPSTRHVTTDISEQRLLIVEAEGMKFTNTISSVLKQRMVETYIQKTFTAWERDRTSVQTNFSNWTASGTMNSFLVITNIVIAPYVKTIEPSPVKPCF